MPELRGHKTDAKRSIETMRELVNLPARPFLFTLDQVSQLLSMTITRLSTTYVYFEGRTTGAMSRDLLLARNIAPRDEKPDWRIAERELIRWLKRKGFRVYDSMVVTH